MDLRQTQITSKSSPHPSLPANLSAKERILLTASRLFYANGVRAVGVDDIIAEAGTAKASFYKYFPSKDDLVVAFIQRRDAIWRNWLRETVEHLSPDPAGRPLAIFEALAQRFASEDFRGCAFISCIFEVPDRNHAVHVAADEHKSRVAAYICEVLQAAKIADATRLAAEWMILIDGAIVTAVRVGNSSPANMAKRMAYALLNDAQSTHAQMGNPDTAES